MKLKFDEAAIQALMKQQTAFEEEPILTEEEFSNLHVSNVCICNGSTMFGKNVYNAEDNACYLGDMEALGFVSSEALMTVEIFGITKDDEIVVDCITAEGEAIYDTYGELQNTNDGFIYRKLRVLA